VLIVAGSRFCQYKKGAASFSNRNRDAARARTSYVGVFRLRDAASVVRIVPAGIPHNLHPEAHVDGLSGLHAADF